VETNLVLFLIDSTAVCLFHTCGSQWNIVIFHWCAKRSVELKVALFSFAALFAYLVLCIFHRMQKQFPVSSVNSLEPSLPWTKSAKVGHINKQVAQLVAGGGRPYCP